MIEEVSIEAANIKQTKADQIIEKVKQQIDNYDPLVSSEKQDLEIQTNLKKAGGLLEEVRNILEVYDFLLEGPKGKEPN